jgi:hypothetical protein
MKNTRQGNYKRKEEGLKSDQKTTSKSAKLAMGSLKRRNKKNLGLKPIISNTKQVVQRDEKKTLKYIELKRGLSYHHNSAR